MKIIKIKPNEVEISGSWEIKNNQLVADENSDRINKLINNNLIFIASSESGWTRLYQDSDDQRYWELTFPNSDYHGGGPPKLVNISKVAAKKIYDL